MTVTVSIAQINPIVGSFKQNLQIISDSIDQAKKDNADARQVFVLPNVPLVKIDVTPLRHIIVGI